MPQSLKIRLRILGAYLLCVDIHIALPQSPKAPTKRQSHLRIFATIPHPEHQMHQETVTVQEATGTVQVCVLFSLILPALVQEQGTKAME